jgi:hypothetical protein
LALVSVLSLFGSVAFGYFRHEFSYIPIFMLFAALPSMVVFGGERRGFMKFSIYFLGLVGIVASGLLYQTYHAEVSLDTWDRFESYRGYSQDEHGSDSLGAKFIVNAPPYLRLIFGFAYLFVFPIPVWSGFQLESAYFLFKSLNALLFYALIPLLGLAVLRLTQVKSLRTPATMFLTIFGLSMAVAVSATSVETRHLGAFLVPLFVVAMIPDLTRKRERLLYATLLKLFLFMMFATHAAWALLKAFS